MKAIGKILEELISSSQNPKFIMFIRHIGEHINKEDEITDDNARSLKSWIHANQDDQYTTIARACEIAGWINGLSQHTEKAGV